MDLEQETDYEDVESGGTATPSTQQFGENTLEAEDSPTPPPLPPATPPPLPEETPQQSEAKMYAWTSWKNT